MFQELQQLYRYSYRQYLYRCRETVRTAILNENRKGRRSEKRKKDEIEGKYSSKRKGNRSETDRRVVSSRIATRIDRYQDRATCTKGERGGTKDETK